MIKKILFISWDGATTSYMEGLFFPIFHEILKLSDIEFHVLQFTWAEESKTNMVQKAANDSGIRYTSAKIYRKPMVAIGSLFAVLQGPKIIQKYIHQHQIDAVMPRATFPAMMVNRMKKDDIKIIFDADGLPIEERVDFSGLSRDSWRYKFLKNAETKLLKNADRVITRSQKSIEIHLQSIGEAYRSKFFVVSNGRNIQHFQPNLSKRNEIRQSLNIQDNALLWIYCGSLGPQYGWQEMMQIFGKFQEKHPASRFLILTGNVEFAENNLKENLRSFCIIKSVTFQEVPQFLSAADIAFALRKPSYSMQGVAPIKLGEYILMGVPSIASKGIGDSEEILQQINGNFLFDHQDENNIQNAVAFAENLSTDTQQMREAGIRFFSIEQSAISYLRAFEGL